MPSSQDLLHSADPYQYSVKTGSGFSFWGGGVTWPPAPHCFSPFQASSFSLKLKIVGLCKGAGTELPWELTTKSELNSSLNEHGS